MTDANHAAAITAAQDYFNAAVQRAHAAGLRVQVHVGSVCVGHARDAMKPHAPHGPLEVTVFRVTKIDPGIGEEGRA